MFTEMLPTEHNLDYRYPMVILAKHFTAFHCTNIGVAGTTPIFVKQTPTGREDWPFKYEVRMGIAICGGVNDEECYDKNPFEDDWRDNFVRGKGMTLEVALKKLEESLNSISRGLF